jgi:transcriptional regulator with XRE-family HTH domain
MAVLRTMVELGVLARAARTARGWNQQEAADAAGVSRRFVNRLEGGMHDAAEVGRVLTLLSALEVRLDATYPDGPASTPVRSAAPRATDDFDLGAHLDGFRSEQGES